MFWLRPPSWRSRPSPVASEGSRKWWWTARRVSSSLRDAAALAHAVTTLLRDPDLRHAMGQAAREHALARFTIRQHVGGVEGVYAELLDH